MQSLYNHAPEVNEIPQRGDGGQHDLKSCFRAPEITEIDELQTYIGQKKQAGGYGQQLIIFYLEF